jgi:uncharacterized protein (TIGR00159 family)
MSPKQSSVFNFGNFLISAMTWHNLLDWSLVALLLGLAWRLVRGSLVVYLLLGVLAFNLLFRLGVWLELPLFTSLLEQFVGLGVLALLVVFQPEIRNFLLLIGRKAESARVSQVRRWLNLDDQHPSTDQTWVRSVAEACARLSETKTGALVVIQRKADLDPIAATGTALDALPNTELLQAIFAKDSPLHDGAVLLSEGRIIAASCMLPLSEQVSYQAAGYGMRHRAALGLSEQSDALVVLVSEESGHIVLAEEGGFSEPLSPNALMHRLGGER